MGWLYYAYDFLFLFPCARELQLDDRNHVAAATVSGQRVPKPNLTNSNDLLEYCSSFLFMDVPTACTDPSILLDGISPVQLPFQ